MKTFSVPLASPLALEGSESSFSVPLKKGSLEPLFGGSGRVDFFVFPGPYFNTLKWISWIINDHENVFCPNKFFFVLLRKSIS